MFFLRAGRVTLQSASAEYVFSGEPNRFKHIVTVNAEIFVIAHENPIMAEILPEPPTPSTGEYSSGSVIFSTAGQTSSGWRALI